MDARPGIAGAMAYTFLRVAEAEVNGVPFAAATRFTNLFVYCYSGLTICHLATIFIVGVYLSHRIVGPVRGFENFLEDLLRGHSRNLSLREGDEFMPFEKLALRFQDFFHERLGINPVGLKVGDNVPCFSGQTHDQKPFSAKDFAGKKTLFLVYRYATCALCAVHREGVRPLVQAAKGKDINIVAIFETKAVDFSSSQAAGAIGDLLSSMDIPLLADPERTIYRAFRARTFFRAMRHGFRQRKILGRLGQLPAYFMVNEAGLLVEAHYGDHFADFLSLEKMAQVLGVTPAASDS